MLTAGAWAAAAWGCASAVDQGRVFPNDLPQLRVVDVQVLREETEITMTNTSAESLPAGWLWINRWFSAPVDGLAVGQTRTLSLAEFRDEYGMAFRAGGFFATRAAERVVSAQYETEAGLIGFIVIREQSR